jgi:uncharacterized protein (TIGR00251 family)
VSNLVRLRLKVVPKASRDGLVGWIGDALKIRVTAAPERGRANAAVVELLATTLGVARECIELIAGNSKERKVVAIRGVSAGELRTRVERALRENTPKH